MDRALCVVWLSSSEPDEVGLVTRRASLPGLRAPVGRLRDNGEIAGGEGRLLLLLLPDMATNELDTSEASGAGDHKRGSGGRLSREEVTAVALAADPEA